MCILGKQLEAISKFILSSQMPCDILHRIIRKNLESGDTADSKDPNQC